MRYMKIALLIGAVSGLWLDSMSWALSETDFLTIGRKYGVSPQLLKAISLVETQNGRILGKHEITQVIDDVQLKFLKKIALQTKRSLADFKGSYAGALGHMQFLPATFYVYAQDGDDDGLKDPLNPYDSLATAAYFIARQMALKDDLGEVLRRYNDSAEYCAKVLALYNRFEVESKFAENLMKPDSAGPTRARSVD